MPVNTVCAYVGAAGEAIPESAPVAAGVPAAARRRRQSAPGRRPPSPAPAGVPRPRSGRRASAAAATPASAPDGRLRISPRASRARGRRRDRPPHDRRHRPRRADHRARRRGRAGRRVGDAPVPPVVARAAGRRSAAPTAAAGGRRSRADEEPRPLTRMRRVIAERLTASWTTTPHFTVTVAVDVDRAASPCVRSSRPPEPTLTVTDFVLSATAQTLAEFPDVNSRTDGVSVWPRRRVHLGVAVSLPGGLVVPVIRDADRLSLGELHDRADRAGREGARRHAPGRRHDRQHLHRLEPRHVRGRGVQRDHQPR